jgi:hypothetical protein
MGDAASAAMLVQRCLNCLFADQPAVVARRVSIIAMAEVVK